MLKVNECSLTSKYRHSIGPQQNGESSHWLGQPSVSAIFFSHQSVLLLTRLHGRVSVIYKAFLRTLVIYL